jgi:hypothetical protein
MMAIHMPVKSGSEGSFELGALRGFACAEGLEQLRQMRDFPHRDGIVRT